MLDTFRSDVRFTFRALWRQPLFVLSLTLILGIGIAASTVVFSVVDALVLRPFPYPDVDRLVVVGTHMPAIGRQLGYFERLSGPETVDLQDRTRTLQTPLAFDLNSVRVRGQDHPVRLFAGFFQADPFATLGIQPQLGRHFDALEIERGDAVVVISEGVWERQFGRAADVVGRQIDIDTRPYLIVGVMPPRTTIYGTDVWLPMLERPADLARQRRQFNVVARLAAGVGIDEARAELATLAQTLESEYGSAHPEYADWRLHAAPWAEVNAFSYRDEALLSLAAVVCIMILVCANLANLLITRTASRAGEIAVRVALGASRTRIVRQFLTEAAAYAALGTLVGLLGAYFALGLVTGWLPMSMQPVGNAIDLDGRVVAFAVLVSATAALLFGAAPALQVARGDLRGALTTSGTKSVGSQRTNRLHRGFVAVQVGLALALLAAAGLLVSSFVRMLDTELGFDVETLISMRLTLPREQYSADAIPGFFDQLVAEAAGVPGAHSVSVATQVSPATFFGGELRFEGATESAEGASPFTYHTVVGDEYFETLGVSLIRGRPLDARDRLGGARVAVINEVAAAQFFPGEDPLGRRVRVVGSTFDTDWSEIVGVASSIRNLGFQQEPQPEVFTHHRQAAGRFNQLYLMVRAAADPYALLAPIREVVGSLDPDQPIYAIGTGADALDANVAPRRVAAVLLIGFGLAALALAGVGVYAVVAYSVAGRAREIGVRLALGAARADVVRLIVRQSMRAVFAGLTIGAVLATLLTAWIRTVIADTGLVDGVAVVTLAGVLAGVALVAAAVPARSASLLDPADALRRP